MTLKNENPEEIGAKMHEDTVLSRRNSQEIPNQERLVSRKVIGSRKINQFKNFQSRLVDS